MDNINSIETLEKDLERAPPTELTALARDIIKGAKKLYSENAQHLGDHPAYKVKRNFKIPAHFTHDSVIGAPGADTPEKPLGDNEKWNEGARATNTGIKYQLNKNAHPQNPYMNTGLTGQGLLWQFGPNHAIDNGILFVKKDEKTGIKTLHALGIYRKDNPGKPAISGGFAKFKETEEGFILDEEALLDSKVEEFFEEMVSGSVDLLPEYEIRIKDLFNKEVTKRMDKRENELEQSKLDEIKEQVITGLKFKQVYDMDWHFMNRIRSVLSDSKECFAGPILNDRRNTNNAWTETRLSWIILTDRKWKYIKGKDPKFEYRFSAGDDADGVHLFKMGPELIEDSIKSHSAMFAFMASSFILETERNGINIIDDNIKKQLEDVAIYLNKIELPKTKPVLTYAAKQAPAA